MLDKPRFKPCYAVATVEPDKVFLISEREKLCLSDRRLIIEGMRSLAKVSDVVFIKNKFAIVGNGI